MVGAPGPHMWPTCRGGGRAGRVTGRSPVGVSAGCRPVAKGLEGEVLLGVGAREGSILARERGPSNVGRKSHRVAG